MTHRCLLLASAIAGCILLASCGAARQSPATVDAEPTPRCPVVPLQLVVRGSDGQARTMLSLDAAGDVRHPLLGDPRPVGRLDPRGCFTAADGVAAEVTATRGIWTRYAWFDLEGSTLRMPTGRGIRVTDEGEVVTLAEDGGVEANPYGGFVFQGYSANAACAARVLWVAMVSMMPSMASSDGHPKVLPPPEGSACAAKSPPR